MTFLEILQNPECTHTILWNRISIHTVPDTTQVPNFMPVWLLATNEWLLFYKYLFYLIKTIHRDLIMMMDGCNAAHFSDIRENADRYSNLFNLRNNFLSIVLLYTGREHEKSSFSSTCILSLESEWTNLRSNKLYFGCMHQNSCQHCTCTTCP